MVDSQSRPFCDISPRAPIASIDALGHFLIMGEICFVNLIAASIGQGKKELGFSSDIQTSQLPRRDKKIELSVSNGTAYTFFGKFPKVFMGVLGFISLLRFGQNDTF